MMLLIAVTLHVHVPAKMRRENLYTSAKVSSAETFKPCHQVRGLYTMRLLRGVGGTSVAMAHGLSCHS
jgi:hypothetical protein